MDSLETNLDLEDSDDAPLSPSDYDAVAPEEKLVLQDPKVSKKRGREETALTTQQVTKVSSADAKQKRRKKRVLLKNQSLDFSSWSGEKE